MSAGKTAVLGDIAGFVRGITFKPDDVVPVGRPGSVACMRTKNIQALLDCSDIWGINERFVKRADQFLQTGDILVSSANSWNLVGKCCWIPDLPWRSTFGGFVSVLRPQRSKVDPRFLFYWFSSNRTQATVRSYGQQTTNISNLNIRRCLKLSLHLPALPEQRRIAEVLDRVEGLRVKRRTAIAQLDSLTQAVFFDLFGDPATNPKGWPTSRLGSCCEIVGGATPSTAVDVNWDGDILWATPKDLSELDGIYISSTSRRLTKIGLASCSASVLPVGSVLFSSRAPIGHTAINTEPMATNQGFKSFVPKIDQVHPLYLYHWLRLRRPYLEMLGNGATFKEVSKAVVSRIQIPLPPVNFQADFARRVGAVERLKAAQHASLVELDALFSALQHRAFQREV